jgi:hypothetical protein|tara:strand:+ start:378 stop:1067 length:690 start_codon:yes stop_codon:yes gene_type:complete
MTSSEPSSPSLPFPNLGDVITTDDVSQKGSGSYKADYVNWCRTMHLLHVHAPGWQFALATAPGGGHIWKAPNGSGYVVGYFINSEGKTTPHFPQAVMGYKNESVLFENIHARDVTDTHRRCLCTAAAAHFGLAWQLWAREEVEDPMRPEKPQAAAAPTVAGLPPEKQPIPKKQYDETIGAIEALSNNNRQALFKAFVSEFKIPKGTKIRVAINRMEHITWLDSVWSEYA